MFHGHLDYFQKPSLGGRPNTKPWYHVTPSALNRWFILFYHMWGPRMNKKFIQIAFGWGPGHIWLHTTLEGMWPHYNMMLEVCWGWHLDTFLWALTISWSWLLARVVWCGEVALNLELGWGVKGPFLSMNRAEFEKRSVQVQDLRRIGHHCRGIGWEYASIE
jgi:hypothetical protein